MALTHLSISPQYDLTSLNSTYVYVLLTYTSLNSFVNFNLKNNNENATQ